MRNGTVAGQWLRFQPVVLLALATGCAMTEVKQPVLTADSVRFPAPPDQTRLVYLTTLEEAVGESLSTGPFEQFLFGEEPSNRSSIITPYGISAWRTEVMVCDTQKNCVHGFDLETNRRFRLGASGSGQTQEPVDIDVADDGTRYVADSRRDQVLVYDSTHRFVRAIGAPEQGAPFKPVSLAVSGDRLYVANAAATRIEVLTLPDGRFLSSLGGPGDADGQFRMPTGVAVDDAGRVYVADSIHARVQLFDPTGSWIRSFGRPGQTAGKLARPRRLTVAPDNVVYIADALFNHVHMFNDEGRILMLFGGPGEGPGSTNLPADVAVSEELVTQFASWIPEDFEARYIVLVTHQLGPGRVAVYAFGQQRERERDLL